MSESPRESTSEEPRKIERTPKEIARISRLFNLAFLGFGLLLGAITIGWPLYQAHQKMPNVRLSMKGTLTPIMIVFFSAAELVGIKSFSRIFEADRNLTFLDVASIIGIGIAGTATWELIRTHFKSLGYEIP